MDDARVTHELEQMEAGLRDLSPVLATFRDRLMEEGYRREEAVEASIRVLEVMLEEAHGE